MPTIEQLHDRWRSDMLLGHSTRNDYGNDLPPVSQPQRFTGEFIGEIIYNPKKESLEIIPTPEFK